MKNEVNTLPALGVTADLIRFPAAAKTEAGFFVYP
jgi:hypothetical protein